jgi:hypothetical protein
LNLGQRLEIPGSRLAHDDWNGQEEEEEHLNLGQRQSPWAYFCSQEGDRDGAWLERPVTTLRRPELRYSCSCFHEGDLDLVAPPKSQGSDENHLHQPCGQR